MTGSALDVEKAVPKSITLTFMGSGRRFITMMLLGCKSPWITPMLASASSAVATLKYNVKDTVQRQQDPLKSGALFCFYTCWMMDLISLRCRGEALTRYWSRFMSSHSNTITRW